jgi:hypothetical protein
MYIQGSTWEGHYIIITVIHYTRFRALKYDKKCQYYISPETDRCILSFIFAPSFTIENIRKDMIETLGRYNVLVHIVIIHIVIVILCVKLQRLSHITNKYVCIEAYR